MNTDILDDLRSALEAPWDLYLSSGSVETEVQVMDLLRRASDEIGRLRTVLSGLKVTR